MSQNIMGSMLQFFTEIGIPHRFCHLEEPTFLEGVKISNGALLIDEKKLLYPGDLLHEAGHIAISSETNREGLTGDMKYAGHQASEEMAAIAWSWAAACHLNIDAEVLFHEHGYKGESENLIHAFKEGNGFGHPLLYYWFMCEKPEHPKGYPNMQHWLRNDAYRESQLRALEAV